MHLSCGKVLLVHLVSIDCCNYFDAIVILQNERKVQPRKPFLFLERLILLLILLTFPLQLMILGLQFYLMYCYFKFGYLHDAAREFVWHFIQHVVHASHTVNLLVNQCS